MKKIVIFGTGYVGLVSGACLANTGTKVVCVDVDEQKIGMLRNGMCPIHEIDLPARIKMGIEMGTLSFTTDAQDAMKDGDVAFITVGTPTGKDGRSDLSAVFQVAKTIGQNMQKNCVVVQKSTVPVGTGDQIDEIIKNELIARNKDLSCQVVSNPEFLKEGNAVKDFESPDRVIIGSEDPDAKDVLRNIYTPFMRRKDRVIFMGRRSAELTKYAANTMLALRISFMNNLARLAEKVGADIAEIRRGIGSDSRIGDSFLFPGVGFGGSCFPKDIRAMVQMAEDNEVESNLFKGILEINSSQRSWFFGKIARTFPSFHGKRFAVWGLAFKPGTDDVREAPSLEIVKALLMNQGSVAVFDPVAMDEFSRNFGNHLKLHYASGQYEALEGADALVILTEEKRFRNPDLEKIKSLLKSPIIFDGRNLFDPEEMKKRGFKYFCVGRNAT